MSLKIGLLSIGEGGSNIGEYAAQKGIEVIAVNSAKVDLDKLKIIPRENRIHLTGWEGAGRDRDVGKEAVLSHSEEIFKVSEERFKNCDLVFVVGSTSGGTGSGGLPVCIEILSSFKNYVGAITILPDTKESPKALMNSLECFSELSQFEQLNSVFIIDNEKANSVFKGCDKDQIYTLSNAQIINNLIEVSELTNETSFVSNFDKNDFLEIINERGCTLISKIEVPTEKIKDSFDITEIIRDSWDSMCFPNVDYGQIVKAAVLGIIPKEVANLVDSRKIFEETGMPYDISESYYLNNKHNNYCVFYSVLSGLSFPNTRLQEIEDEINSIEEDLINKMEASRNQIFQTSSRVSKFKRKKIKEENKLSLSERLSKFK